VHLVLNLKKELCKFACLRCL